ncbi:MAG: sulfatase, partial [Planctomycetota bacterium]
RDGLGCYGNPFDPSPHIDAMALEGIQFEQAISSSGWTLPSIGSILTGTWPSLHGGLGRNTNLSPIRPEISTAAEVFKKNGFDNTFGLANCAFLSPILDMDRGFDEYNVEHAFNWKTRRAEQSIATSLDFLSRHNNESNFVFIHLFDPHLDYDPPPGFRSGFIHGRTNPHLPLDMKKCLSMMTFSGKQPPIPQDINFIKGAYSGEVCSVDAQIGKLITETKKMGIYNLSSIVITSDHGEEFWEHRGFEHGHTLYDELIRIPLIIKPPSWLSPAKRIIHDQVRNIDLMPTLFDLVGINKPDSFLGQSLVPLIMGKEIRTLDAFSESTLYGDQLLSWRTDQYKYIYNMSEKAKQRQKLFDWKNDPSELVDLSRSKPDVTREIHERLSRFCADVRAKVETLSEPVTKNMSPKEIESLKSLGYIR